MTIRLKSGLELECLGVHGSKIVHEGVNRDCLTFLFSSSSNIAGLLNIFTSENCEQIWIISDGSQDLHENYTIRTSAGIGFKDGILHYGDSDNTEVCWISMAQSTLTERQILKLNALLANQ